MTIRHLRIFIAVAETGQMSRAAQRCYLTQPTVSQAIRELEEHYDTLLFERLSKRLHITPSGLKLLGYARKLVAAYNQLEESMQGESLKKHLRIGATMTVGACLLPELLNSLQRELPMLELYSYIANTSLIEKQLLDASLDIALVEGVVKSPDLISIPVIDDYLVLACSEKHDFASREHIFLKELEGYSFVMREQGSGTRSLFEQYAADNHLKLNVACESNSTEAIKNAVMENGYLAVISARLLRNEAREGRIHLYRSKDHLWNRYFNLVYHKDKQLTEEMAALKRLTEGNDYPVFPESIHMGTLELIHTDPQ